jgi:hypothetical protein
MKLKEELLSIDAELGRLEERKREIYGLSVQAPEVEKVCEDSIATMLSEPDLFHRLEYPIEISGISFSGSLLSKRGVEKAGQLVKVRPCAEEFENKTFLGIYMGDYGRSVGCTLNRETLVLDIDVSGHNPTIWIPSMRRVVYGFDSWWGILRSEEDLRQITNENIDGIWYVQALRALTAGKGSAARE